MQLLSVSIQYTLTCVVAFYQIFIYVLKLIDFIIHLLMIVKITLVHVLSRCLFCGALT